MERCALLHGMLGWMKRVLLAESKAKGPGPRLLPKVKNKAEGWLELVLRPRLRALPTLLLHLRFTCPHIVITVLFAL